MSRNTLLLLFTPLWLAAAPPVLQFSTHFGGGWNTDSRLGVDSQGNAYLAVTTERIDLPVSPDAAQGPIASDPQCRNEYSIRCTQIYIAEFSPAGELLRSTYLGGFSGAQVGGIAFDPSGNLWVTGFTGSSDFPQLKPIAGASGRSGVFAAKLPPDLSRVVSATLIPLSLFITGPAIAVDRSGAIYLAGTTLSTSIPLKNAFQSDFRGGADGFLFKLDPSGSHLVYGTFFGGSGYDTVTSVAVDGAGAAIITGYTASTDLPVRNALQSTFGGGPYDSFVAKFSPDGQSLAWSTYLGSQADWLLSLALDPSGDIYAGGWTDGPGPNFIRSATLTRIASNGGSIRFTKSLPNVNGFSSLALGPDGSLWAFAETLAAGGSPTVASDAFQDRPSMGADTILTHWSSSGELLWSTYLAGSSIDHARGVAVDSSGAVLVAGLTESPDFPSAHAALPPQFTSSRPDAFVARFGADLPEPSLGALTNGASFAPILPTAGAAPGAILSAFGEDLSGRILPARATPLPADLAGTEVLVNGQPAPLYFTSPQQVNFVLPPGLTGDSVTIQLVRHGAVSPIIRIPLATVSPGLFRPVVRLANSQLVDSGNPITAGDLLIVYATGLNGTTPALTLDGQAVTVFWSGPAPGFAGVDQINVQVPQDFRPKSPTAQLSLSTLGMTTGPIAVSVH